MTNIGFEGNTTPISLTEYRSINPRRLFFLDRLLKSENKFKFCWIIDGKVLVRKAEGSHAIYNKNEAQIEAELAFHLNCILFLSTSCLKINIFNNLVRLSQTDKIH